MQVHTLFDRQGPARLLAGENGEPERASWARLTGKVAEMEGAGGKRHDRQTLLHIGTDALRVPVGEGSFRAGVMGMVGNDHHRTDGKEGSVEGSVRGYSGGLYGTWYGSHDPLSGPYVDLWSMYGKFDNKVYGGGLPEEKYHSHNWTSSVEAGYGIDVSRDEKGNRSGLVPQVQVVHSSYHSGKHTEKGKTVVSGMDDSTVTTRVGARWYTFHPEPNLGVPVYLSTEVNWWHAPDGRKVSMDDITVRERGPVDRAELKLGLNAEVTPALSVKFQAGVEAGSSSYTAGTVQLGVKYRW